MFNKRIFIGALFFVPLVLQAHHSTALNFSDEVVSFEGTVASVKWINPHGSFVLEVTNEDGVVEEWLVEMLARIALQRGGFDFDAFEEGDRIQVSGRRGYREYTLRFGEAILPDGTVVKERLPTTQRFRK